MANARSRYVNLPAGFLRVFSLEPQIVVGIKETDIGHFDEVLNVFPFPDELASSESLTIDLTEMRLVYPNSAAVLAAWAVSVQSQFPRLRLTIKPPALYSARAWLQSVGFFALASGHRRHSKAALSKSVALSEILPKDNDAPQRVSTEIMNLVDRSGLPLTQDAHQATYVALTEVLENITRHSASVTPAYACAQVHPTTHKFSVCIADTGMGIEQSFLSGPYRVAVERMKNGEDPLDLAVEPFMSSKYGMGHAGLGLFYSSELCRFAQGTFCLTSGAHTLSIFGGNRDRAKHSPWKGTIVTMLLDTSTEIDSRRVWDKLPSSDEADYVSFYQATPSAGISSYDFALLGCRLFTRDSAKTALDDFLSKNYTGERVCISLDGVTVATPSFIDEFFRGLFRRIGEAEYRSKIIVVGATSYLTRLIELVLHDELERVKKNQ